MSILHQLSSHVGDRSEYANRKVVVQCLEDPTLLDEIAAGLAGRNAALNGDCAEVLTMVAQDHPDWVLPYAPALACLITHKTSRVRWEAIHALALVSALAPEILTPLLPALARIITQDASVIARDYAVDALGNYTSAGKAAAGQAYPLLMEALTTWDGKQAGHALRGLINVAAQMPDRKADLLAAAEKYAQSERGVVRKAARDLRKSVTGLAD